MDRRRFGVATAWCKLWSWKFDGNW